MRMVLNGRLLPSPRQDPDVEYVNDHTRMRAITGKLTTYVKNLKKRFVIPYQGLTPEDAIFFTDLYESGREVSFEYEDLGSTKTTRACVTGISRSIYSPKPEYTKGVTVIIEEV